MVSFQLNPNLADQAEASIIDARQAYQLAADYLRESIVDPSAYVVNDYQDAMLKDYGKKLDDGQIADLVAYLLTQ